MVISITPSSSGSIAPSINGATTLATAPFKAAGRPSTTAVTSVRVESKMANTESVTALRTAVRSRVPARSDRLLSTMNASLLPLSRSASEPLILMPPSTTSPSSATLAFTSAVRVNVAAARASLTAVVRLVTTSSSSPVSSVLICCAIASSSNLVLAGWSFSPPSTTLERSILTVPAPKFTETKPDSETNSSDNTPFAIPTTSSSPLMVSWELDRPT